MRISGRPREVLSHIRQFALARRASPWAVLGCVLVRVIAATPPRVVLPALVGGVGSLNLFVALVGESGAGKGAAMSVAADAVELGHLGAVTFGTHTVGSGQGLAHAYAHRKRGVGMVRHADAAVFVGEEVDHLVGLTGQTGSTLLPELRRLYMGERLGHLYVDPAKRMEIAPHSYRAALVAGVQPARAGVLLDDADGGTPQRFVWLPVAYPHPDHRPAQPDPWRWTPPRWEPNPVDAPTDRPAMPTAPQVTLPVASVAAAEIDAATLARARGQGDQLDGHRLLCREKIAAALGILDQRAEVSPADWELAGWVLGHSDATRAAVVAKLAARSAGQNMARARFEAHRAVIVADTVEAAAVARVGQVLTRLLDKTGGDRWAPHRELRSTLSNRDRGHFGAAIEHLVAAGQIEVTPSKRGTQYRRRGGAS